MLKLAKNHSNAKQHPEAEFQLFENYSNSSSTLGLDMDTNIVNIRSASV